ncbi:hypothetical protein SAY86_016277 [Trapa natans]|uniref:Isopentenyl-diphosphate delta-isomerase n=1 Tax=Trapa natans TaxID=22666 RepID=A0AAN7LBZ8_TRANT|nr:hypothetical protein SAY86_016277 [Trapa natans]
MSGIGFILDLLRKNPSFHSTQTLQSHGLFCATAAASAAAASVAAGTPFASRFLFGNYRDRVTYCDAGAAFSDPTDIQTSFKIKSVEFHPMKHLPKLYKIELKPLFSAFEFRAFAMTSLRSFLLYYLPLLEPRPNAEDNDNFLNDSTEERHVDLVVPFKKSVKQIVRETSVVTTRRVLERLAVIYVSQRMAWKLLKDIPKSALRKYQRGLPTIVYMWRVSRTTFRGHLLGVAATWLVQVGIDTYRILSSVFNSTSELEEVEPSEQAKVLWKKVFVTTVKCCASLVFAAVGAGLGAIILRPSLGQWIGCAAGDLAGPIIVSIGFEKLLHMNL